MTARVIPRVAALLLCLSWCGCASTRPRAHGSRVVWAHSDRAYVASPDSLAPAEGDSLAFVAHGRTVAAGVVAEVLDGGLAAVRVTSGSFVGVGKLEQLGVIERPRPDQAPGTLRVGAPGPNRPNLLFGCSGLSVGDLSDPGSFNREKVGEALYRFVADRSQGHPGRATPFQSDTILVRLFDESTDEEIALERGDLDVAVFWPGELSTHMREQPRWRGYPSAARSDAVLAALLPDPAKNRDSSQRAEIQRALRSLNEQVFRGDLVAYPEPPDGPGASGSPAGAGSSGAVRFEVDRACPGWEVMERFLNRGTAPQATTNGLKPVRITCSDGSPGLRDSVGHVPLFEARCPVVCAPGLRPYVRTIAPALVNMLDCGPASRDR